jgi:hypothetical protein
MDNDQELEKKYLEFAANLHFFEFIEEEFKPLKFEISDYNTEIQGLTTKTPWNKGKLSRFVAKHPRSFDVLQQIFQLRRFTDAQLIEFLFDTSTLNTLSRRKTLNYLKQNITCDERFLEIFVKVWQRNPLKLVDFNQELKNKNKLCGFIDSTKDDTSLNYLIYLFKSTVAEYIRNARKDNSVVHERLANEKLSDVSERFSKYMLQNLRLNDFLRGLRLEDFLEAKRIPKDTKSIHGNFGKKKLRSILDKHRFLNADPFLDKKKIKTIPPTLERFEKLKDKFAYATERYVEGVNKPKEKKPKKFDFVLLYNSLKILIETNFYTTSGTKIGINEGEYVDLYNSISKQYKFLWITDGNYWLLPGGRDRFQRLYRTFGEDLLNYNLFDSRLEIIKEKIGG